ncbi:MAG TPA: DciA family protein [bacterium]|nr:DciA family protein [bacterium]
MDRIGDILAKSLAKRGLKKTTESAQICFYAEKWGKGLITPISFSGGILKVSVSSSSAASEIQLRSEECLDFINEKLKKRTVRSIRIINRS